MNMTDLQISMKDLKVTPICARRQLAEPEYEEAVVDTI